MGAYVAEKDGMVAEPAVKYGRRTKKWEQRSIVYRTVFLTTKEEQMIEMRLLRVVTKKEKIIFPIMITVFVALFVSSAAPLVGYLFIFCMESLLSFMLLYYSSK